MPFQCWVYVMLSLAPRAMHLLNTVRAVHDIGKRGAPRARPRTATLAPFGALRRVVRRCVATPARGPEAATHSGNARR